MGADRKLEGLDQGGSGQGRPWWRSSHLLLWLVGGTLALLLLIGVVNLVAPRALVRLTGGSPVPAPSPTSDRPRAAIIDQTGYSFPSPDFIDQAVTHLERAGYEVTYHPPEDVTVNFYRTLPDQGYDFILFQTHSTSQVVREDGGAANQELAPGPFLFTTERYAEQRHLAMQLSDQVRASELFYEGSPQLFAVGPEFVRRSMRGLFPDTTIIIGGCQSLAEPDLAEALLDKGAAVVIGWDEMVNLSHNNRAVARLLEALLEDRLPPAQAVRVTMEDVGPDPAYGSVLDLLG